MAAKDQSTERGYWQGQIAMAQQTYSKFFTAGDTIVDRYRIERANGQLASSEDKFNMLYSSVETVGPSLYAQTPKPEVKVRHKDRKNPVATLAANLMEACLTYAIEEVNLDDVIDNAVQDYLLPGWGNAWVRYEATFKDLTDESGAVQYAEDGKTPKQIIDFEALGLDYVNWKDILYGPCRTWAELPWAARRVYMGKEKATSRFGAAIANKLTYTYTKGKDSSNVAVGDDKQAVIWEIWHKESRKVIWYSENFPDGLLEKRDDFLKLKTFFPCPKPLRAISNTKTFVPRPFFAQYQNQQDEMDRITQRIRYLTEALQVRGVYDASQEALAQLLSPRGGNKMIPVQDWASFLQGGGLKGAIDFVPVQEIASVLMQLYDARDRVKAEIYEITGFGDIMRGASKASETLGAQRIKQDWASARLKKMQKEVQRFARDILRLMGEIIAEQFTVETLGIYAGYDAPDDQQLAAQYMAAFQAAVGLLRNEKDRCALIDVETDSTLLADEENERKDRLEFLGQIGAFLQQAGPMAMEHPEMRGLLGALMMFVVRTFPASRPIEMSFEDFEQKLAQLPPVDPNQKNGDNGQAAAQATVQAATIKAQSDTQVAQMDLQVKQEGQQLQHQREVMKMQNQQSLAQEEQAIKRLELEIKRVELQIKIAELGVKQDTAATDHATAAHEAGLSAAALVGDQQQSAEDGERQDAQFAANREDAAAEREAQATAGAPPAGENAP